MDNVNALTESCRTAVVTRAAIAGFVILSSVSCTHPRAASPPVPREADVVGASDGAASTPSQPAARIRSALVSSFSKHDDSLISVSQHLKGGCVGTQSTQRPLFVVTSSETTPDGYVDVEVTDDRPTRILYTESSLRTTCSLAYEVPLKSGGRYVLQGGRGYTDGAGSALTGSRVCSLEIRDEQTQAVLPLKAMKIGDFCRRYPLDRPQPAASAQP